MPIPMREIGSKTMGQLRQIYGDEELQNTKNLLNQLGREEYGRKYGGYETETTASERGAAVPYDPESGLFTLKNLGALVQNLPGNAVDTYTGIANMATNPTEAFNTIFSKEGFDAMVDDIKYQVSNPSETAVERPFETLLNLTPFLRGAGTIAARTAVGGKVATSAAKVAARYPTLSKAIASSARAVELSADPLAATAVGGGKLLKGITKVAEEVGFKLPASAASGISRGSISRLTDQGGVGGLTPEQELLLAPKGTFQRAKQILVPESDKQLGKSKYRAFREVLKGVRDEEAVLTDIIASIDDVDANVNAAYTEQFPDVLNASQPLKIDDAVTSLIERMRSNGIKVTEKYVNAPGTKEIRNPNYRPSDIAGVSDADMNTAYGRENVPRLQVPQQVKRLEIDTAGSDLSTVERSGLVQPLNNALDEVNAYLAKAPDGMSTPKDMFRLYTNIQNVINLPAKGAGIVDTMLLELRDGLRKQLGELDGLTPGSGKSFNDLMGEVEARINFAQDVRKEFGLYKAGKGNIGSVLRKLSRGSKGGESYMTRLTQNLGARGADITTAIEAMEFKGFDPRGLVGRQLQMSIPLMLYAGTAVTPWALIGIPFALPRVVGEFSAAIGVSKRASRFVGEMVEEMNTYPSVKLMAKNGYTIGGILLNHGRLIDEANKREKAGGR